MAQFYLRCFEADEQYCFHMGDDTYTRGKIFDEINYASGLFLPPLNNASYALHLMVMKRRIDNASSHRCVVGLQEGGELVIKQHREQRMNACISAGRIFNGERRRNTTISPAVDASAF